MVFVEDELPRIFLLIVLLSNFFIVDCRTGCLDGAWVAPVFLFYFCSKHFIAYFCKFFICFFFFVEERTGALDGLLVDPFGRPLGRGAG